MDDLWTKKRGFVNPSTSEPSRSPVSGISFSDSQRRILGNLPFLKTYLETQNGNIISKSFGDKIIIDINENPAEAITPLSPIAGAWCGDYNDMFLLEDGTLINILSYTTPTQVKVYKNIISAGVDGLLSWCCTRSGKLYIWGGLINYTFESVDYSIFCSPLQHFHGSYNTNTAPLHIFTKYKIKYAHFVKSTTPDQTGNEFPAVNLIFITMDNLLYSYTLNPPLSYSTPGPVQHTITPDAELTKLDSSVKTARILHTGYNIYSNADDILSSFKAKPLSAIWLKLNGLVYAIGLNASGEAGSGSSAGTSTVEIPFDHEPTFEEYYTRLGYVIEDLVFESGQGDVQFNALGRSLFGYYSDIYIPDGLWAVAYLAAPLLYSQWHDKRKVLDGPYTDLTTRGVDNHLLDALTTWTTLQFGVQSPNTYLLNKDFELFVMGNGCAGGLGDYSDDWVVPPLNGDLDDYMIYAETPVRIFSSLTITDLYKTNASLAQVNDEVGAWRILQFIKTSPNTIKMWGSGVALYGNSSWPTIPHTVTPPTDRTIKFIDSGQCNLPLNVPEFNFSELLVVTNDNYVYKSEFNLYTNPAFTYQYNLDSFRSGAVSLG